MGFRPTRVRVQRQDRRRKPQLSLSLAFTGPVESCVFYSSIFSVKILGTKKARMWGKVCDSWVKFVCWAEPKALESPQKLRRITFLSFPTFWFFVLQEPHLFSFSFSVYPLVVSGCNCLEGVARRLAGDSCQHPDTNDQREKMKKTEVVLEPWPPGQGLGLVNRRSSLAAAHKLNEKMSDGTIPAFKNMKPSWVSCCYLPGANQGLPSVIG
jgi:hypothetical protein